MQKHGQMLVGLGDPQTEAHMPSLGVPHDFPAQPVRKEAVFFVVMNNGAGVFIRLLVNGVRFIFGVKTGVAAAAPMVARLYQTDLNAEICGFHGQTFGVPFQCVLAGGIGALERNAQKPVNR